MVCSYCGRLHSGGYGVFILWQVHRGGYGVFILWQVT